jgi:hypothetical protein
MMTQRKLNRENFTFARFVKMFLRGVLNSILRSYIDWFVTIERFPRSIQEMCLETKEIKLSDFKIMPWYIGVHEDVHVHMSSKY